MKKNTLLNAMIITLLIIASASFIVAAFTRGTFLGLVAISVFSAFYALVLCAYKD